MATASLFQALKHGRARHTKPDVPWRIRGGMPQVGTPKTRACGLPSKKLVWKNVSLSLAKEKWYQTGWILE